MAPVGGELTFRATAEVPPGTGVIVAVEWDFDGSGRFAEAEHVDRRNGSAWSAGHSFAEPGTYFPAVRVVAQRAGDTAARTPGCRTWRACASSSVTRWWVTDRD